MLNRNQSDKRFATGVATGLAVSVLMVVAALVQAATTVQSYL
jgi:hypothetical protein